MELANNSIISYPSGVRIQDFVSAWDRAYYVDTTDGRYHYVIYPYEGNTLDLWGNSNSDLLELIRQFVTPSEEISIAIESSLEYHQYFEDVAKTDFGENK